MTSGSHSILSERQQDGSRSGQHGGRPTDEILRAYVRLKLDLAAQVRALREISRKQGDDRRRARCEALMVKLAEDRFTLAVLGQFKRGKSSLMNSIIGRELLPVGVLPLTSAITVLRFGPHERLLIQRERSATLDEVSMDRLTEFVTEHGNSGNRQQVRAAYLELPSPFLRRGLEFVDTPGVGSSIAANTTTTYDFLPECDAVLFVTSAEAPLNRIELEFLRDVRRYAAKVFIVVNKIDLLDAAQREDVLAFVHRTLSADAGIDDAKVFPVSALLGLAPKMRSDDALYAQCGLGGLESALADFLVDQKATVFLASVRDKAARLLKNLELESEVSRHAQRIQDGTLGPCQKRLKQQLQEQSTAREEILQLLWNEFREDIRVRITPEIDAFFQARKLVLTRQVERFLGHVSWLSGRAASRRFSTMHTRFVDRDVRIDLMPRLVELISTCDLRSLTDWRKLCLNLIAILHSEAERYGITDGAGEDPDLLPAFELADHEISLPPGRSWAPDVSAGLALLPARWSRGRLAEFLVNDGVTWLETCREHVNTAVNRSADNSFGKWSEAVGSCARAFERQMQPPAETHQDDGGLEIQTALASAQRHLERVRGEIALISGGDFPSQGYSESFPDLQPSAGDEKSLHALSGPYGAKKQAVAEDLGGKLRTRGCAVCAHLTEVTSAFLSEWQYELVASEAAQNQFARELGFCSRHQWQLEAISSPVGISVGHAKLARRVGSLLDRAARDPTEERALKGIPDAHPCRVCQLQENAEALFIERLVAFLREKHGREAYAHSQGLCLQHLSRLVSALSDDDAVRFVLSHAGKRFGEIAEEMESYGLKTEALRRQLNNSNEDDAYWRATTLLAGSRNVCLPWPKEQ